MSTEDTVAALRILAERTALLHDCIARLSMAASEATGQVMEARRLRCVVVTSISPPDRAAIAPANKQQSAAAPTPCASSPVLVGRVFTPHTAPRNIRKLI